MPWFEKTKKHLLLDTECLCCSRVGRHSIVNLCTNCEIQLPQIEQRCTRCAMPLYEDTHGCGSCLSSAIVWDNAYSAFTYDGLVKQLILKGKHNKNQCALNSLAQAFCLQFEQQQLTKPQLLVPIPMHWSKQVSRGFNQSSLLASIIGKKLNIDVVTHLLASNREHHQQKDLTKKQRLKNLADRFYLKQSNAHITDTNVTLFDDVMTTGATLNEAAHVLKLAGVNSVECWTVARTTIAY